MKLIITLLISSGFLFASEYFKKETKYTCLNTYSIEQGNRLEVKKEDALKKPLEIILKEDKLYTGNNVEFTFRMKRGDMLSYSNQDVMLLLTNDLGLGLVPKKARGQLQYFFKCEQK